MFAHPIMLAGIGGAVLPLVLHLLNRARYRNIRWGAMMFLGGPANAEMNRIARLRTASILILRILIIALLAIALARPILNGASDSRVCVVLLIDNSAGMAFDEGTAGQRIETARAAALAIVNRLQHDDEVHVVLLNSDPNSNTTIAGQTSAGDVSDLQSAASQIADLSASTGLIDIAGGLNTAAKFFTRTEIKRKVIVLIADRELSSWRNVTDVAAATFRQQMLAYGGDVRLLLVPIGSENSENVAIDRINLPPAPFVRGETIAAQVVVHNYGVLPAKALPIETRVVGERSSDRRMIDLGAGETRNVDVPIAVTSSGYYLILARIGDDAHVPGSVTFDDQAQAVVNVVDPIPVHIVDNNSSGSTTRPTTQAQLLMAALTPFASSGSNGSDAINATTAPWHEAWADQLTAATVVVLCDTPAPDPATLEKLKSFVQSGGGLILFPSTNDFSGVNALFGTSGIAPVSLRASPSTKPVGVVIANPIWRRQFLGGHDSPDAFKDVVLSSVAVMDHHSTDAEILTLTTARQPWLIGRWFGRGRVIVATGGMDSTSGNLFEQPIVVPLMRGLVQWCAAGGADRLNLQSGEALELHNIDPTTTRATITLPDNSRQESPVFRLNEQVAVRFSNTGAAGRYTLELSTPSGVHSVPFIVRPSREASDLTPISSHRLNQLSQLLDLRQLGAVTSADLSTAFGRDYPRELWKPLLLAAMVLVVAELWWSNRFSGGPA